MSNGAGTWGKPTRRERKKEVALQSLVSPGVDMRRKDLTNETWCRDSKSRQEAGTGGEAWGRISPCHEGRRKVKGLYAAESIVCYFGIFSKSQQAGQFSQYLEQKKLLVVVQRKSTHQ